MPAPFAGARQGRYDDVVQLPVEGFPRPGQGVAQAALGNQRAVAMHGLALGGVGPVIQLPQDVANGGLASGGAEPGSTLAAALDVDEAQLP